MLSDWVDYENKNGVPFERILYTNIPLSVEKINEYLRKETGIKDCDVSKYIELLDDTFFSSRSDWWEEFENGAMVVIDEVHHYLPASIKRKSGGQDTADLFMNYVSTHRHRQQDIIFLTQHLNNIAVEIKRMAEVIYEVLNIKNTTVGIWPFKVQMEDIDLVRQSWGMPVQLAHIKRGVCSANTVEYDKQCDQFFLTPALFGLYQSHTLSNESLDRPSLKLGKVGSLIWIIRKYLMRFGVWGAVLIAVFIQGKSFIENLPLILERSLKFNMQVPAMEVKEVKDNLPAGNAANNGVAVSSGSIIEVSRGTSASTDEEVIGFVTNGVITKGGIKRAGDVFMYKGVEETVKNVNLMHGIVFFSSGKKYQK
jgi:hypothetical protein